MELDSSFDNADRQRIQALKAQLQWKCTNIHQGNRFRLVSNPYKRTHTIYFPKDTDYNPTLYNYLLELTRAFYCEKYGPIFGDIYFDPSSDREEIPLYSDIIAAAQHWFTAAFCLTNFEDIWHASLKIKYQSMLEKPDDITAGRAQTLNAALICAQLAWIEKRSTTTFIEGGLRDMVNIFVACDPTVVDVAPVAVLVNNLFELYQQGATLQFNAQKQGAFWKMVPA